MCLVKTHRLPKISRKPIQCYKIFSVYYGILYTPYRYVFCQVNDIIKAKNHWLKGIFKKRLTGEVVHAFRHKDKAERNYHIRDCVCLCEIPPFTPYWCGKYNEIGASKIKIIKKL